MEINLNDPNDFTLDNFRILIAFGDDKVHNELRITNDQKLILAKKIIPPSAIIIPILNGIILHFTPMVIMLEKRQLLMLIMYQDYSKK